MKYVIAVVAGWVALGALITNRETLGVWAWLIVAVLAGAALWAWLVHDLD